jgi:hypothetical protein
MYVLKLIRKLWSRVDSISNYVVSKFNGKNILKSRSSVGLEGRARVTTEDESIKRSLKARENED